MKKSSRLQRIVRLSTTTERLVAQALAQAQHEHAQLEAQTRDLRAYQAEYLKRLQHDAKLSLNSYEAQQLLLFVRRIEAAIADLGRKLEAAARRCTVARERWVAQHRKVSIISEVAARARATEEVSAAARLQHEIEDRVRPRAELATT